MLNHEIAWTVYSIRFLNHLNDKLVFVFSVDETGQAEDTRGVGRCWITAEMVCDFLKQGFRLVLGNPLDFPNNLMFSRRRIKHKVWCGNFGGIANGFKRLTTIFVEVKIDMPNFPDVGLRPVVSAVLDRIHSQV